MEDILKKFAEELSIVEFDCAKATLEIEALYPEIISIVQKNNDLFTKTYTVFDRPLSELNADILWKYLPTCIYVSFTTGNIGDKLESLIGLAKSYLMANPNEKTDEISKILNSENAESSIKDFIEYCTNTRIARILNDILTNFDASEYEYLLKNPEQFMEIAQNPDHPIVHKFVQQFQNLLKERVQRGEINQHQLTQDIEGIKAKLTGMFGNALMEALGGTKSDTPAWALNSNSPEARRQRMLARLQKKQREKPHG